MRALLVFVALTIGVSLHGAVVTWGIVQNIAGDSDVSTAGTFTSPAHNYGGTGVGDTTVNGVLFLGTTLPSGGVNGLSVAVPPFTNLSAPYQTLLASATTQLTGMIFSGPTILPGQTYQIEFWVNNSSVNSSSNTVITSGNSVTLSSNTSSTIGGLGQFVLGTFVADTSGRQDFSFAGTLFLSGYQLRNVTVPEPSIEHLLAMGACATALLRRKRHGLVSQFPRVL